MRAITIYAVLAVTLAGCGAPAPKENLPAPAPEAFVPANVAPVTPTAEAAPPPQSIAQAAADDNEVICRSEKPLGTRIGKRVCKTRAQFKLEEETARRMMNERDRKGHGSVDPVMGN
ncbi:hypothetical protein [Peristeroidobacter agariperforans]|uniref:hypothetical protein n=1 Tax=Peristeroidobacter agariperforans TaxID=268404 RepID=UPI00101DF38D|nr:hypothetical protein [Peristeroidobacter agariperforans]